MSLPATEAEENTPRRGRREHKPQVALDAGPRSLAVAALIETDCRIGAFVHLAKCIEVKSNTAQ